MSTPTGVLDPELFVRRARTLALATAQEHKIFLGPEALPAIDTLVKERMPGVAHRFRKGTLDFAGWEKLVSRAAEMVAQQLLAEQVRSLNDPDALLERVRSVLSVYPFDC